MPFVAILKLFLILLKRELSFADGNRMGVPENLAVSASFYTVVSEITEQNHTSTVQLDNINRDMCSWTDRLYDYLNTFYNNKSHIYNSPKTTRRFKEHLRNASSGNIQKLIAKYMEMKMAKPRKLFVGTLFSLHLSSEKLFQKPQQRIIVSPTGKAEASALFGKRFEAIERFDFVSIFHTIVSVVLQVFCRLCRM